MEFLGCPTSGSTSDCVLNYAENKSHPQGPVLCSIVNCFFGLSGSVVFLVTTSQTGLLLEGGVEQVEENVLLTGVW